MTHSTSILDRLQSARTAVSRAALSFEHDGELRIEDLEREVDLAAAAATHVAPENRGEARKALVNLAADLTDLQIRIRKASRETAEGLGRNSANRQALTAYGRRR